MNRRDFLKTSAWTTGTLILTGLLPDLAGLAYAGKGKAPGGAVKDSQVKAMDFDITYATTLLKPPRRGGIVRFWVPLPESDQEQDVTGLSIDSPAAYQVNIEPEYGNRMVFVQSDRLREGDRITLAYRLRRKKSGMIRDSDDGAKHLKLTERERSSPEISSFVDTVVGGEKDPMEIGRKIYYALVDLLTYDKEIPGCGMGISEWTFKNRGGRCDDFHALFRTMMISKGVPVRWEQGLPLPYPSQLTAAGKIEGDCTGAHCWVRFYIGDGRWVPVDVSEADKREDLRDYFFGTISPNRFKVSSGRDIVLSPPQGGEPLNTFPFAHGEARGIPMIYGHNFRNEIHYKVLKVEV